MKRRVETVVAVTTWVGLTLNVSASVYIRSMPAPGTWAEWRFTSDLFSPGVEAKVRLLAGSISTREGRQLQTLSLTGTWEDDSKAHPIKATYEVDRERLKKDGHACDAARVVEAWWPEGEEVVRLAADDPRMVFYKRILYRIEGLRIEKEPTRLDEPTLREFELKKATGIAETRHFGGGEAPESKFEAWIGDDVPFGAAQWRTTTELPLGRKTVTVVLTAKMSAQGTEKDDVKQTAGSERSKAPATASAKPAAPSDGDKE